MVESEKKEIHIIPAQPTYIHVGNSDDIYRGKPDRINGGMFAGGIGAFLGWLGGEAFTHVKMWEFNGEVKKRVRNDLLNGGGNVGNSGRIGAGLDAVDIRGFHEWELARSEQYKGTFAAFVSRFGRLPITMGAAVVTGTLALLAYFALAPKKEDKDADVAATPAPMENVAVSDGGVSAQGASKEWGKSVEKPSDKGAQPSRSGP